MTVKAAQDWTAVRVENGLVCIDGELFEITTIRELEYVTPSQTELDDQMGTACPN